MCTILKKQNADSYGVYIAKNYDVPEPFNMMLFINPVGEQKQAFILPPEKSVRWNSIYRSITYNQVCKDFPAGGMNEKGLVVEQATLWNTLYPDRDSKPAIRELQWIQFMLDTCSTTKEVLEKSRTVRISQETSKLHYFICDRNGTSCLIEYIMGEAVYHEDCDMPYPVVTNDMYGTCLDYLHIHDGYGGSKKITSTEMSIDRFVRTVQANNKKVSFPKQCFDILMASVWESTQLSIVFDTENGTVFYRAKDKENVERVDFKDNVPVDDVLIKKTGHGGFTKLSFEDNFNLLNYFMNDSHYFPTKSTFEEVSALAAFTFGKE